jgi:hypothetical protein
MITLNPVKQAELAEFVAERISDKSKIKHLMSIAVGIAVAFDLCLPAERVCDNSAQTVFGEMAMNPMCSQIAAINEQFVISLDLAETVGRAFWLHRYSNAFPPAVIPLVDDENTHFMGLVFGTGHLIPPDVLELCNLENTLLITVVNKLRSA